MKQIENGKENIILFTHNNEDLIGLSMVVFSQIGADITKSLSASLVEQDCFTFSVAVNLSSTFTPNGLYTIDVIDNITSRIISSATATITGMDMDNKRAYIIEDVPANVVVDDLRLAMTLNGKL